MKLSAKEVKAIVDDIKKYEKVSFKNEHGEKFNIHSNGTYVFMSGDEVNAMVDPNKTVGGYISLFNEAFSIWTDHELIELGTALKKLGKASRLKRHGEILEAYAAKIGV